MNAKSALLDAKHANKQVFANSAFQGSEDQNRTSKFVLEIAIFLAQTAPIWTLPIVLVLARQDTSITEDNVCQMLVAMEVSTAQFAQKATDSKQTFVNPAV